MDKVKKLEKNNNIIILEANENGEGDLKSYKFT